jgi:hypothetical protein
VIIPRLLWRGEPVVVDGDEAASSPPASPAPHRSPLGPFDPTPFPPRTLADGSADALFGRDVWSGRLVTALFGGLQAVALVAASARLSGAMGALTTATVLCLPLELHFERLNLCNVWTTATWSLALAVAVLAGWRIWAGALTGALLAAGWYGYQSSRLVPLIVAAPLLVLLVRANRRQVLVIAAGALSFLVTLSPLLYGFWLAPDAPRSVRPPDLEHRRCRWCEAPSVRTLAALSGTGWDSTAFFPYHVSLFRSGRSAGARRGGCGTLPAAGAGPRRVDRRRRGGNFARNTPSTRVC